MGGTSHVEGGMPSVLSPRRTPNWGSPGGENNAVQSTVRLLLLQGDALRIEPLTAMLAVTSKYNDVIVSIAVITN